MRPIRFTAAQTFAPQMEAPRRWWQGKKKHKVPTPKTMVIDQVDMGVYDEETDRRVDALIEQITKEHPELANDIRMRTRLDPVVLSQRNILNVGNASMLGIRRLTNEINAALGSKDVLRQMAIIRDSIQKQNLVQSHGNDLVVRAEVIARLDKDIENLRKSLRIDTIILDVSAEGADKFYTQMIESRLDILANGTLALDQLAEMVMSAFTQHTKLIADRDILSNLVNMTKKETDDVLKVAN